MPSTASPTSSLRKLAINLAIVLVSLAWPYIVFAQLVSISFAAVVSSHAERFIDYAMNASLLLLATLIVFVMLFRFHRKLLPNHPWQSVFTLSCAFIAVCIAVFAVFSAFR